MPTVSEPTAARAIVHARGVARPRRGLGAHERELAAAIGGGGVGRGALGEALGEGEVVGVERLLRAGGEVALGALGHARAREVIGEHRRLTLAGPLEPLAREPVAERAVLRGERRVGDVAHERVHEAVFVVAADRGAIAERDHLARHELLQPRVDVGGAHGAAHERAHPASPEHLAEDARGAEHAARRGVEPLDARLEHRDDAPRQLRALGVSSRPSELLEEERVASGALDDRVHRRWRRVVAEHRAGELIARALEQRREADLLGVALGPEVGEEIDHLGPREADDEEGAVGVRAQRPVDEPHAREVAPVEVFEREDERLALGLGAHPVVPRPPDLVAHQDRVEPRGAKLHARALVEGRDRDLSHELGDALGGVAGEVPAHARAQLVLADDEGVALLDPGHAPHRSREEPERGARAHGVGAPGPHRGPLRLEPRPELRQHPGLADPGRPGDDHDPSHALVATLGEEGGERGELAVAAHARRRSPEHGAGAPLALAEAADEQPAIVAADVEAQVEEARRGLVEEHGGVAVQRVGARPAAPRPRRLELGRGALDDVADDAPPRDRGEAGRERDRGPREV